MNPLRPVGIACNRFGSRRSTSATARLRLAAFIVLGLFGSSAADAAQEHQVKAAYVYQFVKFVEWPARAFATPQSPLVFCTVGDDGLNAAMAGFVGRTAQGRLLAVKRVAKPDELKGCHVLVLGDVAEARAGELLRAVAGSPTLTVGDIDRFVEANGMIGLVSADDRVQFDVNLDAAHRVEIGISAQLLKLARIVYYARSP